jgi:hypothetical protein
VKGERGIYTYRVKEIQGSETSVNINQTLGIHPKIETVNTEHSESLKSRNIFSFGYKVSTLIWVIFRPI